MPGRDELLQQNIARAQSRAAGPQPQENVGRAPITAIGAGGPRSFFGGNYEVYSALESIQFQGALGDASMRGNIAYIRIWRRGGTAAQTNSGAVTQDPGDGDALTILGNAVEQEYGPEREGLPDDAVIRYDTDTLSYSVESGDLTRDEDGNITNGFVQSSFLPTPNPQRQQALGTQTPTTSGVQSSSTQIVAPVVPSTTGTALSAELQQGIGQVRSANPNGFTNALLNFGRSFIGGGGGSGRILYSGQANAPRGGVVATPTSGDMMWQFLFNPSELQLEAGPEFKGAEVWGVSDKANSGQPLHWSHNKNASLKFNSVLLNGFVFGRKVEALEQGLLELFMSREGEGQYGPHVLEFVWGKRSFGPCVIKNIDVKEKMWDEGEVVNAELSFTLEQVPEWTINDGAYVDVARPGRQPLANDPIQSSNAVPATAAPATSPTPAPGGGSSPAQKPPTAAPAPSAQFCTQSSNAYSNFNNLGKKSNEDWLGNNVNFFKSSAQNRIRGLAAEYNNLLTANGSVVGRVAVDSRCRAGCNEQNYYDTDGRTLRLSAYLACVRGCSYQVASRIQGSILDDRSCPRPQFIRPL